MCIGSGASYEGGMFDEILGPTKFLLDYTPDTDVPDVKPDDEKTDIFRPEESILAVCENCGLTMMRLDLDVRDLFEQFDGVLNQSIIDEIDPEHSLTCPFCDWTEKESKVLVIGQDPFLAICPSCHRPSVMKRESDGQIACSNCKSKSQIKFIDDIITNTVEYANTPNLTYLCQTFHKVQGLLHCPCGSSNDPVPYRDSILTSISGSQNRVEFFCWDCRKSHVFEYESCSSCGKPKFDDFCHDNSFNVPTIRPMVLTFEPKRATISRAPSTGNYTYNYANVKKKKPTPWLCEEDL